MSVCVCHFTLLSPYSSNWIQTANKQVRGGHKGKENQRKEIIAGVQNPLTQHSSLLLSFSLSTHPSLAPSWQHFGTQEKDKRNIDMNNNKEGLEGKVGLAFFSVNAIKMDL